MPPMYKVLIVGLLLCIILPTSAAVAQGDILSVYYAGPDGGVRQALELDKTIELVTDQAQAQVFVLDGVINERVDPRAIHTRLEEGAGLILILGLDLHADQVSILLGEPVTLEKREDVLSLTPVRGSQDAALREIVWNSAPQVRERFTFMGSTLYPLVVGFEDQSLVLGAGKIGQGQVFVFTPLLYGANPQVQEWAYFNYLIYHLVQRAAGREPLSFADYPGSPVPHHLEQIFLFIVLAGMLVISGIAFWLVRSYSLRHPEALDVIVANKEAFSAREAGTDWEEIGFHRPLGGFFLTLFFGMVLFVPLIIYQNLILPVYILPSAQALGIWGRVTQFFTLIWTLFDMGTSVAFIKYLSQYRIHDPRQGVKYGQVFIWWQALSGAVQVAIMVGIAGTVMPHTAYALYAWSVIVHTFIQIPGFYQIFRHALTGLQRCDYAQVLDLGWAVVFPILTQPVFVLLMVAWGRAHPMIGPSMGGLIGLGLAAYATEVLMFVVGWWLYHRLGYNARIYFLAHFDWQVIKKAFRFGVFEMLGSAAWAVGQSLEILITQSRLVNYAEVWGNWVLAQNFVYAYNVVANLYNNMMPSISEAISHGRRMLSQYYSAMAYKWGGLISAMLASILLAIADRFILGASGPEFVRAAAYSTPLLLWGAVQYPSWVGDNVQRGANRPDLMVAMVGLEQIIRVVLALVLLEKLQINALIVAYFVGIMTKNIVAYFINHRLCFPQRFYVWQSLVAPVLAGAAHYGVLRWIGGLIWQQDQVTSIIIFFIAILPSYPIFAFFYGLFGGWDDATLEEVKRAASLSSFMRPLAWLFWAASVLGACISPLHGRFPISNRSDALAEALSLEQERVSLV
jgi:O-antigen/teichoic acid export membrane protein